jgi:hypothetical protein
MPYLRTLQYIAFMTNELLAYLAGAIDSDGCISIKKSTYHMRVRGDATNAVYSERLMLKQVTPQIPELLHDSFGGMLSLDAPSCKRNGRPLWNWQTTDKKAASACAALLPFLRVKKRQAELALELRRSKSMPFSRFSYWFELENPKWRDMPMLTAGEAARAMGYKDWNNINQAIRNGSLLCLPWREFGKSKPRFPEPMIRLYAEHAARSPGRRIGRVRPAQLIQWRENLWQQVRELNKIGVYGTPTYHRTGVHAPAAVN